MFFYVFNLLRFFAAIFSTIFAVFRTAEAYFDGIFRENGIFNDVILTSAILNDE